MRSLHIPTIILLVSIIVCVLSLPSAFKKKSEKAPFKRRHVRNLYQFATMIACATNRSGLDYYDYGCWCGFGGSGTPVDQTDRCCYIHDACYDNLIYKNTCSSWWMPYYSSYLYTPCHTCVPESSYPSDDNNAACRTALCECDSKAVQCFATASFNASNIDYDTTKC
ncbi:hypothetical protein ACROYT_G007010 [Oculina patagonica]